MESPEYNSLMKQFARASLSGLAQANGAKSNKRAAEAEIEAMKKMIDRNELEPEICKELTEELLNPGKLTGVSRPFRNCFTLFDGQERSKLQEAQLLSLEDKKELDALLASGKNILIRGVGEEKKEIAKELACSFFQESGQFQEMKMLVRKCSKKTTALEIAYDRRHFLDGRTQLGYITQGMMLAEEHPEELYVLILDEVETVDLTNVLADCMDLLKNKGTEKLIAQGTVIRNRSNFVLIATQDMGNDNPNKSMENMQLNAIFEKKDFYQQDQIKKKNRKML